jgi:hypothetical protein
MARRRELTAKRAMTAKKDVPGRVAEAKVQSEL